MVSLRFNLPSPAVPYDALRKPFVDRFGQFAHDDWPDKVHDERELAQDLRRERALLKNAPTGWDEWGGARDLPRIEATGAFRTEKVGGRWWLVSPSGSLFFSHGIDTLRHFTDSIRASQHPDWFEAAIPKNGRMAFPHWNLQRKFGKADYLRDYYEFIHARLDSWGFNTVGRWSAWNLPVSGRHPYLAIIDSPNRAPRLPGTRIYDVFHPEFQERFRAGVSDFSRSQPAVARAAGDPLCIGLSVDNEMAFETMIPVMMAQDFRVSPAKNAFFDFIRRKYDSSLGAINDAWGTNLATWPALASLTVPLPGAGFVRDAELFRLEWLRIYFKAARDAVKAVAPRRLYFSAAFAGTEQPESAWIAASEFSDVIMVDVHEREVAAELESHAKVADRPILVGAFNFGCLDRGMFAAGPCPVSGQAARAEAYLRFMRGVLESPNVVGCHYFQYRDQPIVGRDDGEAFQIGFVDVCDRPYSEITAAARTVGETMYNLRTR